MSSAPLTTGARALRRGRAPEGRRRAGRPDDDDVGGGRGCRRGCAPSGAREPQPLVDGDRGQVAHCAQSARLAQGPLDVLQLTEARQHGPRLGEGRAAVGVHPAPYAGRGSAARTAATCATSRGALAGSATLTCTLCSRLLTAALRRRGGPSAASAGDDRCLPRPCGAVGAVPRPSPPRPAAASQRAAVASLESGDGSRLHPRRGPAEARPHAPFVAEGVGERQALHATICVIPARRGVGWWN